MQVDTLVYSFQRHCDYVDTIGLFYEEATVINCNASAGSVAPSGMFGSSVVMPLGPYQRPITVKYRLTTSLWLAYKGRFQLRYCYTKPVYWLQIISNIFWDNIQPINCYITLRIVSPLDMYVIYFRVSLFDNSSSLPAACDDYREVTLWSVIVRTHGTRIVIFKKSIHLINNLDNVIRWSFIKQVACLLSQFRVLLGIVFGEMTTSVSKVCNYHFHYHVGSENFLYILPPFFVVWTITHLVADKGVLIYLDAKFAL